MFGCVYSSFNCFSHSRPPFKVRLFWSNVYLTYKQPGWCLNFSTWFTKNVSIILTEKAKIMT